MVIPTKLPIDIPKFEGKSCEDPSNHVMNYHVWCVSNSLNNDSVRLQLFQQTLTSSEAKCYEEFMRTSINTFNAHATTFLTHFQFIVRYDNGTKLLTSLK